MSHWEIAVRAASWAEPDTVIGLGTGRAAAGFTRAIGARVRAGLRIRAVPTSGATGVLARSLGIPLVGFEEVQAVDLAVDGADEVDPDHNLIKGHGGALVRERVVAAAASRFVVLVGPEKLSPRLGAARSVPVEVIPFAAPQVARALERLGAEAPVRKEPHGQPFVTDNGNFLLNASFGAIADPGELQRRIRGIPGVVDSGLFVGMTDLVLVEGDRLSAGIAPPPAAVGCVVS